MLGLIYGAAMFWAAVYLARLLASRRGGDDLPLNSTRSPSVRRVFRNSHTTLTVDTLRIHLSTTLFNRWHDRFLERLNSASPRASVWVRATAVMYDIGSLFGAIGQLGALALVLWTLRQLLVSAMNSANQPTLENSTLSPIAPLTRRAALPESPDAPEPAHTLPLQLIVGQIHSSMRDHP
jgi:hypothetical protein